MILIIGFILVGLYLIIGSVYFEENPSKKSYTTVIEKWWYYRDIIFGIFAIIFGIYLIIHRYFF